MNQKIKIGKIKYLHSLSPTIFVFFLILPNLFYFAENLYLWHRIIVVQLGICLIGFLIKPWRVCALITLVVLFITNANWIGPNDYENQVCSHQIDKLSGINVKRKPDSSNLVHFMEIELWCKGNVTYIPYAVLEIEGLNRDRLRWLYPGNRFELKNFTIGEVEQKSILIKPKSNFRYYNLTSQETLLNRSNLYVFIKTKSEYYLSGFPRSVFKALTLADRRDLSQADRENLSKLGITHVFAISGMHIGILYLWLSFVFRTLFSHSFQLIRAGTVNKLLDLLSLLIIFSFLTMIGMPVSALRAFMMLCWWVLTKHLLNWHSEWFVFSGVALLILLFEPAAIGQISFQLSFLSVFGILQLIPFLPVFSQSDSLRLRTLKMALSTMIVSFWLMLFTLPIINLMTGFSSFLAPINNVIHIFIVSFLLLPIFMVSLFILVVGFIFRTEMAEYIVFSIVNFASRLWEEIININLWFNQFGLVHFEVKWSGLTMFCYWAFLWAVPFLSSNLRKEKNF